MTNDRLHQAVGRLLSTRLPGLELEDEHARMLKDGTVGGVVYFQNNCQSIEQLLNLIEDTRKSSFHPPVLSVDEEGGAVQRFFEVLGHIPSPMNLGANLLREAIYEIAHINGSALRMLGLNCILAPGLDVFRNALGPIISTRSFGSSPAHVAACGQSALNGYRDAGIVSATKHFPGHGGTSEDSHAELAVNKLSTEMLWQVDLLPFKECLPRTDSVLIGHIWVSSIDEEPRPASISSRIVKGILRGYLKFDGLIMSDDMIMKGLLNKYSLEEACLLSLKAGLDHLLVCTTAEETKAVHKYLVQAVLDGKFSEEDLADSIRRTDRLFKAESIVSHAERMRVLEQSLPVWQDRAFVRSQEGIALLRGKVPDFEAGEWLVIAPDHPRYPLKLSDHLNSAFRKIGRTEATFSDVRYSVNPTKDEIATLRDRCEGKQCLFVSFRAAINVGQRDLAHAIWSVSSRLYNVASESPFDAAAIESPHLIATFDPSDLAMRALANLFAENRRPAGVNPVTVLEL